MEQGQPLPFSMSITSYNTKTNRSVKGIPCYVDCNDRTALYVVSDSLTNDQGFVTLNVTKAPIAKKVKFQACIDDGIIERALPKNFATSIMLANVRKEIKPITVEGYSFDPTVFYYFDLDSIDKISVGIDIENILAQKGWKKADNIEDSDLVVKSSYTQQDGEVNRYGKYNMKKYVCSSSIIITSNRTDQEISRTIYSDLELFLRADSQPDKVHMRASIELLKRMLPVFSDQIQSLGFDKRKEVYDQAIATRK